MAGCDNKLISRVVYLVWGGPVVHHGLRRSSRGRGRLLPARGRPLKGLLLLLLPVEGFRPMLGMGCCNGGRGRCVHLCQINSIN